MFGNVNKIQVASNQVTLVDYTHIHNGGLVIVGSEGAMVSSGFRSLRIVNPYTGDANIQHSWAMGPHNQQPTASDNDFYFETTKANVSTVVAYLQDAFSVGELDFTGQHRCVLVDTPYSNDLIGRVVCATGK